MPEDFKILQFEEEIIDLFDNDTIAGRFFAQHPQVLRDIETVAYTSEAPTPQAYFENVIKPILAKDYES